MPFWVIFEQNNLLMADSTNVKDPCSNIFELDQRLKKGWPGKKTDRQTNTVKESTVRIYPIRIG